MNAVDTPDTDHIERAHQQGTSDATATIEQVPTDPLLRVAWAIGFAQVDLARAAVRAARDAGATWEQIAVVTGTADRRRAEARYGAGRERKRAYRERRRAEHDA